MKKSFKTSESGLCLSCSHAQNLQFIIFRLSQAQALFNLFVGAHTDIVMKLSQYMDDDEEDEDSDTQFIMLKVCTIYIGAPL